jgi:hypothetical protein
MFASRARHSMAAPANGRFRFSGALYQLYSTGELSTGAYVRVNGPHDTFGVIKSSKKQPDGRFLNLIRGSKPRIVDTPVASF